MSRKKSINLPDMIMRIITEFSGYGPRLPGSVNEKRAVFRAFNFLKSHGVQPSIEKFRWRKGFVEFIKYAAGFLALFLIINFFRYNTEAGINFFFSGSLRTLSISLLLFAGNTVILAYFVFEMIFYKVIIDFLFPSCISANIISY